MKKINTFLLVCLFLIFLNLNIPVKANEELMNDMNKTNEILVKYDTERLNNNDWEKVLLEPVPDQKWGNFLYFPIIPEEFIPELGLVKYQIPDSVSFEHVAHLFRTDSRVEMVARNEVREGLTDSVTELVYRNPHLSEQWGLEQFHLPSLWEFVPSEKRNQITVAVLDSGVDLKHEDLTDVLVPGYDFVQNDEIPDDDSFVGHGTHVAGIIGAMDNDKGIIGVASGVKIMPVKILDSELKGDVLTEIKGILWAVKQGAKVINLSIGGPHYKDSIDAFNPIEYAAIQYAISKGVIVVASAGNEATDVSYPAAYPDVIAVTSIDSQKEISFFANRGPEVSVAAPGEDIFSAIPNNQYSYLSGTSMSAPFVSGISALLLAQNPLLTSYEVKQKLETGADDRGESGKDDVFGYGLINPIQSIHLPITQIHPEKNVPINSGDPLQVSIKLEDNLESVASSVYSTVSSDVYLFHVNGNKSYNGYFLENMNGLKIQLLT